MGNEREDDQLNQPETPNQATSLPVTEVEVPVSDSQQTGAYLGMALKDRYLIERVIGRGGIGVVYLARDRQLVNRPVVIKVLHQSHLGSDLGNWFKKKFQQEIEALSRIDHPGVVGVLDTGEMPDGRGYFVMQYVEGVTLRSAITQQGVDLKRTAYLIRQMGQALSAAHDKGVLHRDLKPENIMIQNLGGGDEQVKLIDFGIAQVADSQIAPGTQTTKIAGTPPYMAPEQIRGRPTVASDIFALGAIAYEMVTGVAPFEAETQIELYEAQREGLKHPPRSLRPALPAVAEEAILKALSFDQKDRYPRARDFGDALSAALLGENYVPEDDSYLTGHEAQSRATLSTSHGAARPTVPETGTSIDRPTAVGRRPFAWLLATALVIAAIAISIFLFKPASQKQAPVETVDEPARSLNYWVTVQKYRDGKPYQAPFRLPGEILFEKDYRVKFAFSSPQSGFLYLINEGPQPFNHRPAFVVLFPKPSFNNGSAQLAANQEMTTSEFSFDEEQGTEKLWLIWSANQIAELEAVKGVVNPKDRGIISAPGQIQSVQDFLNRNYSTAKIEAERDETNQLMSVKGRGDRFVHLIKLDHH